MKSLFPLTLLTKLCIILALIAGLVYANTLSNDYVMDDVMMITENHIVKEGISGIPELLATHHLEGFGANKVSDYYRPLSLVMFAIEYQVFGLNASEGHLLNIVFFAACVVLLFLFLNKLFDGQKLLVAFVAALLFAVHPVHTEVVANIKSRDELLCFFFSFLALNIFIDYVMQGRLYQWIVGVFLLLLAVLSKETVVTFLAILPLVFFFYKNENKQRSIFIMAGIVAVVVFFFFMWNYVQSRNEMQETLAAKFFHGKSVGSAAKASYMAAYILILGYHIRLLFVPYPLDSNYSFRNFTFAHFGHWEVILSLVVYIALITVGLFRLFKYKKDPWAFGILFYLSTLALYANIVAPLGQAMANRYEFFPSVGFCLLLALAFEKWVVKSNDVNSLKKIPALAVLLPVMLCYSALTVARNADWKDNFTLVNADISKSPGDYTMEYKVGLELQEKYNKEQDPAVQKQINSESKVHFLRSLDMNPDYTESHADLGVAYLRENNFDSAEIHFRRVIQLNPKHYNATVNLATLFFRKQQFREAVTFYQGAVQLEPKDELAWYNMGICYSRLQLLDSSLLCMKKVIELAPQTDHYKSYGNVAIIYEMTGKMDSARKYEQITQQYFPSFHLRSH